MSVPPCAEVPASLSPPVPTTARSKPHNGKTMGPIQARTRAVSDDTFKIELTSSPACRPEISGRGAARLAAELAGESPAGTVLSLVP